MLANIMVSVAVITNVPFIPISNVYLAGEIFTTVYFQQLRLDIVFNRKLLCSYTFNLFRLGDLLRMCFT